MSREVVVTVLVAVLAGGLAGGVTAWLLGLRPVSPAGPPPEPSVDPFVDAEIDLAAVRLAEQRDQPESAGLIAERLRLLHRLGLRKGWF